MYTRRKTNPRDRSPELFVKHQLMFSVCEGELLLKSSNIEPSAHIRTPLASRDPAASSIGRVSIICVYLLFLSNYVPLRLPFGFFFPSFVSLLASFVAFAFISLVRDLHIPLVSLMRVDPLFSSWKLR